MDLFSLRQADPTQFRKIIIQNSRVDVVLTLNNKPAIKMADGSWDWIDHQKASENIQEFIGDLDRQLSVSHGIKGRHLSIVPLLAEDASIAYIGVEFPFLLNNGPFGHFRFKGLIQTSWRMTKWGKNLVEYRKYSEPTKGLNDLLRHGVNLVDIKSLKFND